MLKFWSAVLVHVVHLTMSSILVGFLRFTVKREQNFQTFFFFYEFPVENWNVY